MTLRRWRFGAMACVAAVLAISGSALASVPAWTTYRHDASRSGMDPDSASPVSRGQVWQTPALDAPIYAQPLLYGSRVYVATENDTVYALDAATGAVVWQRHLATPVDAAQLPCGNITPTVGITSTPVIDPATGRIYVVADTWDGSHLSSVAHEMYALNLADGSIGVGPAPVDPPGAPSGDTPPYQLQRASLALNAGKVLIGYGGNSGDCGSYHGWLVAEPEAGGTPQAFEVDSQGTDNQGAIWGSGNAPAVDSSGDVWISTGNGNSTNFDFSESVVKLDSDLKLLDWWAPSSWQTLDTNDTDLGSSMPVLLPGGLVFEIGKQGTGYLLNASSLGHTGAAPVYSHSVCGGSWGGAIYVNGVIYVTCSNGLHALSLNTTAKTFAALSGWTVNGSAVGPPTFAGGLVWSADYNGSTLYGLDPAKGSTTFSANLNGFEHFTTPSAGGGLLFVANQDASATGDDVTAFRIASAPPPSMTTTGLSSSPNPAGAGRAVTLTATVSPRPDAGTVSFSDGGAALPGCGAMAVSVATGQATCTTAFSRAGTHAISARYSGDAYYLASTGSLNQVVTPPTGSSGRLSISHVHAASAHRRLRLRLTVSGAARLTVVVSRLVPGRMVRHRCRARARHGRRCTARLRRRTLHLSAHAGANRFRPRMDKLASGRYAVTVNAVGASGARSRPVTVVVVVHRR